MTSNHLDLARQARLFGGILAGLFAAGCMSTAGENSSSLTGEWMVEDIAGRGMIDNSRATLVFRADGAFSGRASCNIMASAYRAAEHMLTIQPVSLSRATCPPAIMNQEALLVEQLSLVRSYSFDETDALILEGESGALVLARGP